MTKKSAGILLYRTANNKLEFFLVHPGGPFWAKKDNGAWSIPKGEFANEKPGDAARREFFEETGKKITGRLTPLSSQKLKSGKIVFGFAIQMDIDPKEIKSNLSAFGWPEVDRGQWFDLSIAKLKINPGQVGFLDELTNLLDEKVHGSE